MGPNAGQVARADPDRWRAAMTAPPEKREGLFALHAFNLEIARAPFVTREPMLAEIRLRWWADAIAEIAAGHPPRRHEITEPLARAIRGSGLPPALFTEMIEARALDIGSEPLPDRATLDRYLAWTAAHHAELAARHLGVPHSALPTIRDFATGTGIAALLRALPDLRARGHDPLPPGTDPRALARDGLALIARARANRATVPAEALPALLPGALASTRLARAARGADMEVPEIRARFTRLARGLSGRW